jgi:hypothetical protein
MKKILILPMLALFALGCEEIVEVEKIVIQKDTVKLQTFVDRYFAGVDSTKIPIVVETPVPSREAKDSIIIQKDTVWAVRVDTLWRVETVTIYDTLVKVVYQYGDTLIVYGGRDTYSVPEEVRPILAEFYQDAALRGHNPNGGEVIIEVVPMDAVLQAQSFEFNTQVVIRINDNLTEDERFLPLYRELSRWQLGKEYSQDPESVLFPFYPANVIRWSNRAQYTSKINEFF